MKTIQRKKFLDLIKGQKVVDQWHPEKTYALSESCGLELRNIFKTSHEIKHVQTDHDSQATLHYGPGLRMFVALTEKDLEAIKEKKKQEAFGVRLIFDLPKRT